MQLQWSCSSTLFVLESCLWSYDTLTSLTGVVFWVHWQTLGFEHLVHNQRGVFACCLWCWCLLLWWARLLRVGMIQLHRHSWQQGAEACSPLYLWCWRRDSTPKDMLSLSRIESSKPSARLCFLACPSSWCRGPSSWIRKEAKLCRLTQPRAACLDRCYSVRTPSHCFLSMHG